MVPTPKSQIQGPWNEWLLRDDRDFLNRWSSYSTSKKLAYIKSIVTSIHWGQHANLRANISENRIEELSHDFYQWLKLTHFFTELKKKWAKGQNLVTYSLSFFLSREYCRFKIEYQTKKSPKAAASNHVELISSEIINTFQQVSNELPADMRLPFLLHLDGLTHFEISKIIGLEESQVETLIFDAKALSTENLGSERFGT